MHVGCSTAFVNVSNGQRCPRPTTKGKETFVQEREVHAGQMQNVSNKVQRPRLEEEQVSLTSLLPRPNPLITGPDSLIGKGGSGPESGPATGSRGPSGRISPGNFDLRIGEMNSWATMTSC